MFHEMRRKDRSLSQEDTVRLLQQCKYGILSTLGKEYPYGVPISYVYEDGVIYIHGAVTGEKLNRITENPNVSFCVVGKTQVLPGDFTTNYESAILFGKVKEVFAEEKQRVLELILQKYSPDFLEKGRDYIQRAERGTRVFKIVVEHLTGKSRK